MIAIAAIWAGSALFVAAIILTAPEGYEDAAGFHRGKPPESSGRTEDAPAGEEPPESRPSLAGATITEIQKTTLFHGSL